MADFVLKNISFEFNLKFFQQISGTAIGTKFVSLPPKPVDRDHYPHYNSCHAKSSIYNQTSRLRRICSERKDLKSHVNDLKGWFLRRGYPQRIVEEQMDRAFRLPVKHDTQQNKIESGISLVFTYNPAFSNLTTTSRKNYNILYSDVDVRTVFTPSPFVAHRSA